jgi:hypothetical protein
MGVITPLPTKKAKKKGQQLYCNQFSEHSVISTACV